MFRTVPLSSSGVFHCTHSNGICHKGLVTACEQDQDGVPSWCCSQTVSKPVWHIPLLCVQWINPDDGQRNCPKHVQFHSKNIFEKLLHLVAFIIRIYHYAPLPERQKSLVRLDLFCEVPWSHYDAPYSVGLLWTRDRTVEVTSMHRLPGTHFC